jgi:hypothetical protein
MKIFEKWNEVKKEWETSASYKTEDYASVYFDVLKEEKAAFRMWENGVLAYTTNPELP